MTENADSTRAPTTFGELVRAAAQRWPDTEALVFPEEQCRDARLTWRELHARAEARAHALRGAGLARGDRLALLLPNGPEFLEWTIGAALAGAIAVPLNVRFRAPELAHVLRDARAAAAVVQTTSPDALPDDRAHAHDLRMRGAAALAEIASTRGVVVAPEREGLTRIDWPACAADEIPPTPDPAYALLMYTSGTTARPKGCAIRHSTWLAAARALAHERYSLRTGDRFWNPLPMFHMAALHPFAACASVGATFVSMTRFDAALAVEQIDRERIDVLYPAFPTILADLVNAPGFRAARYPRIRRINCVAPPDTLRALQAALPQAALTSVYGLTEAGGVVAYGRAEEPLDVRACTCGRTFEGIEVRIAGGDGTSHATPGGGDTSHATPGGGDTSHATSVSDASSHAPPVGEIQLRGWCVFDGYWRQPEATAAAFTADGWLRTGDLGSLDAEGRLRFHGRAKDVLKVGGENVSAVEVESVLSRHPAVKLAQVVGAPHARLGEVAAAFVELKPGATATAEELIEHCRPTLASFKLPRIVRFVNEWPMSATKIQKYRLREQLTADATP